MKKKWRMEIGRPHDGWSSVKIIRRGVFGWIEARGTLDDLVAFAIDLPAVIRHGRGWVDWDKELERCKIRVMARRKKKTRRQGKLRR